MLDLKIINGQVIDGTGAPSCQADVGVRDGKIVLGSGEDAREILDARGKYVCPGFVDAHSHGDGILGTVYGRMCKACQGITTEVAGQCGESMAPVVPGHLEDLKAVVAGDVVDYPEEMEGFTDYRTYFNWVSRRPLSANIRLLTGHSSLRAGVMGYQDRRPDKPEMEQMKMLLREAMEQGSLGLSSGLIYAPGCYADREELTELCRVVAEYGGIYTSHMRNESDDVVNGVKEALTIGREAGVPVFISHHKICGVPNWGKSVETLKLVEEARQAGQQVTLDQYPYLASMTNMSAVVPPDHFGEGAAALARRLGERGKGDRLWRKIAGEIENRQDFENQYRNCGGWENILISSLPETKEYEGMTVAEAARRMGRDGTDAYLELFVRNKGRGNFIYFSMCEEDLCRIFQNPNVCVGTDGLCRGMEEKGHPRAWSSFPHAIAYFQKEKKLLTLEEMIHKITLLPAQRTFLEGRGAIRDGWAADLVILDYDHLEDRADYLHSNVPAGGIDCVLVNGQIVYQDGRLTGKMPGRLLRRGYREDKKC